jgi:hypothetical protein
MKQIAQLLMGCVVLAGMTASAQSLGDYARTVRKDKGQPTAASKHYDNDNLPKTDHLSVVGQAPAQAADSGEAKTNEQAAENSPTDSNGQSTDPAAAPKKDDPAERQKVYDEWKKRIQEQKDRIAELEKELDITNREYRLRAAVMYADIGNRLRNSAAWDKEDRDYKQQIAQKEKAVADAKQKLEDIQEDARKAAVPSSIRE